MKAPENTLKKALKANSLQFGCWVNLDGTVGAEIVGRAGFDWALIDAEHGPNGINDIMLKLQVLEGLNTSSIVRVPIGETWIIKQVLDAGAQSILVPIVEDHQQASELVQAVRYPPIGKRGVGSAVARAAHFGNLTEYLTSADEQICLVIQLETQKGLLALDDLLEIEGIDGIFIGPSDLSADMGYLGNPEAPEVQDVILGALKKIANSEKVAGILSLTKSKTKQYIKGGAKMIGIASDVLTLNEALKSKTLDFKK